MRTIKTSQAVYTAMTESFLLLYLLNNNKNTTRTK